MGKKDRKSLFLLGFLFQFSEEPNREGMAFDDDDVELEK